MGKVFKFILPALLFKNLIIQASHADEREYKNIENPFILYLISAEKEYKNTVLMAEINASEKIIEINFYNGKCNLYGDIQAPVFHKSYAIVGGEIRNQPPQNFLYDSYFINAIKSYFDLEKIEYQKNIRICKKYNFVFMRVSDNDTINTKKGGGIVYKLNDNGSEIISIMKEQ